MEIVGYTLEVDLHYPKEIEDLHNDYPIAPERYLNPKPQTRRKFL
jgi:hypothetical protein